jgi:hypothetical protein
MRATKYWVVCDQKMIVGKDVAALLHLGEPLSFGQILRCTDVNVRTRYQDKLNQLQPIHFKNQGDLGIKIYIRS